MLKRSGTIVSKTMEYRNAKYKDMSQEFLDIGFRDNTVSAEKGQLRPFLTSGEDEFGQSP